MLGVLPPQIEPVLQQIKGSFLESPGTFSGAEAVLCCSVFIQDESFNNFEKNAMKLLLNDAKSTGLWARNCATIEQFLILKFAPRARKVSGRFEKQGPGRCKLSEYWLFIGSNYVGVTPYTGVLHH